MMLAALVSTAAFADSVVPHAPGDLRAVSPRFGAGGEIELSWVNPPSDSADGVTYVIGRSMTESEAKSAQLERRKAAYERHYGRLIGEGMAPEQARTAAATLAHEEVPPHSPAAMANDWVSVGSVPLEGPAARQSFLVTGLDPEQSYRFQVLPQRLGGPAPIVEPSAPVRPAPGLFLGKRIFLLGWIAIISGAVIAFILLARGGMPMRIRRIAALEAVDEAVGRATEMGRPVLFIPGIQDMDNVQTIAGITVLSRVAKTVAEYDATIEVPTARSLAMQASREAVQASYMEAGRSESFNPDVINYITDEQFGFVAYVGGRMVREKPAACFYMGCFFAESLILAETGNSIGAIQIAGTAESSQLPFFVAACDYTLIGEEFFAASAYLSGEPDQLGSIKGQDVGKALAIAVIVITTACLSIVAVVDASGRGLWIGSVARSVASLIRMTLTS